MQKPWYAEREFILTVGGIVGGIALILAGEKTLGVQLLSFSIGGFAVSRGLAKQGS